MKVKKGIKKENGKFVKTEYVELKYIKRKMRQLLKEIEKEIKEVEDDLNQTYRREPKNEIEFILKAFAAPAGERVEGYLKGLKFAYDKIKKVFEGWLENDR